MTTPELKAVFALDGSEVEGLAELRAYLEAIRDVKGKKPENGIGVSFMVLHYLCEALDPNGKSQMQLVLKKRNPGKPHDWRTRLNAGRMAVKMVADLVDSGMKKEAAVSQVAAESGLSRSAIFAADAQRRRLVARVKEHQRCGGKPLWE